MSIDDKAYYAPATKGEVAAVAIRSSIATRSILSALYSLKAGGSLPDHELEEIKKAADELSLQFNKLTGWVDE